MNFRHHIMGRWGLVAVLLAASAVLSCSRKVSYTELQIKDPVRHYHPILQGQELTIIVPMENIGEVPLTIKDVQPSCGCIREMESGEIFVPPVGFAYRRK